MKKFNVFYRLPETHLKLYEVIVNTSNDANEERVKYLLLNIQPKAQIVRIIPEIKKPTF